MTLLITIFAAIIATMVWYQKAPHDEMKVSMLCSMYWGASLMWSVDALFAYIELQAAYFTPTLENMINDAFLGVCVVALGLVIWLCNLFYKDPQGKLRATLFHK